MDYQVNLETFRGPLDLLLYLVKRDEVDIRDISISRLAEQFQDYLNLLSLIDVELAGDFLVMASTLMEIKSKSVLPRGKSTTRTKRTRAANSSASFSNTNASRKPPFSSKPAPNNSRGACRGCRFRNQWRRPLPPYALSSYGTW